MHGLLCTAQMDAILLEAVDQDKALEGFDGACLAQRRQEVPQHGAVDFCGLAFVVAREVCAEEDILALDGRQGALHLRGAGLQVERLVRDPLVFRRRLLRSAQCCDLCPFRGGEEVLDYRVPRYACGGRWGSDWFDVAVCLVFQAMGITYLWHR